MNRRCCCRLLSSTSRLCCYLQNASRFLNNMSPAMPEKNRGIYTTVLSGPTTQMSKLNRLKNLVLNPIKSESAVVNSEPFIEGSGEIISDNPNDNVTNSRIVPQGCSLYGGFVGCSSFAESTSTWQPTLEPNDDVAAMDNLDTYSYYDGHDAPHYSIADTSNSKKKRYRYRGFSSSISQLFLDESLVCGAFSCFGLLLSCRTVHLLQQRQRINNLPLNANQLVHGDGNPLQQANRANYILSLSLIVTLLLFFTSFLLDPNSLGVSPTTTTTPYSVSSSSSHARAMGVTPDTDAVPPHASAAEAKRAQHTTFMLADNNNNSFRPRVALLSVQDYSIFSHLPMPSWLVSFAKNAYPRWMSQENYYAKNAGDDYYYDDDGYAGSTFDNTVRQIALTFFLLLLAVYGTVTRRKVRREILRARQQQDRAVSSKYPYVIISPLGDGLNETSRQSSCVHVFFGCYPVDPQFPPILGDEARQLRYNDFVQRFFSMWSTICCGCLPIVSCWMQCFGVCALAQEAREARNLLSVNDQRIDYITHQPWKEYEPQLVELRLGSDHQNSACSTFIKQIRAMSKFGKGLWAMFLFLFVFITVAMFNSHRSFELANAAVLLATFGQSFLMLYMVHRIFTKSYLSLDAITKFFAAGFLLAVPSAFILEMVLTNIVIIVVLLVYNILYAAGMDSIVNFFYQNGIILMVVFQFFNAFIVAAMTEELCKYFVFRMVEHPDISFMSNTRSGPTAVIHGEMGGILVGITNRQKAAAVTIAMLSVALGLACAENFLYVFYLGGKDGGKASEEFMTLVFRSIFPVHAMCAAMQSVSVVKKYIELDPSRDPTNAEPWVQRKKIGVGTILTPAIILHGSFDAVLMVVTLFVSSHQAANDDAADQSNTSSDTDAFLNIFAWVSVVVITISGAVWYFRQKAQQKSRLQKLDDEDASNANLNRNGSAPIVSMYRQALEMT